MKFIHIADVHLGASPEAGKAYQEKRGQEIWDTFSQLIALCEEEKQDLLLIAGDLFHRQPLLRDLKEVNYLFSTLSYTKVVLIAGNHDYLKNNSQYRDFAWADCVYPLFEEQIKGVVLKELDVAVYGFSYHHKEIRENKLHGIRAPKRHAHEFLLVHGGDEKHLPFSRDDLVSSGFTYIALGHIHKAGQVVENIAYYSGSLEPLDKNEIGEHGFIRGEAKNSNLTLSFVPFSCRKMIHEKVTVEEGDTNFAISHRIKAAIEEQGVEHIYKIILIGERSPELELNSEYFDPFGNVIDIADETIPAFDFVKLYEENKENIIGKYIQSFGQPEVGSLEYQALWEGVRGLLESRT